jgi:hypothetical protein
MPDIAFAGVMAGFDGLVAARIPISAFHRNHAGGAIYSILGMRCAAKSISGYGFPSDLAIGHHGGASADRRMRQIQQDGSPFGRSCYALKAQTFRRWRTSRGGKEKQQQECFRAPPRMRWEFRLKRCFHGKTDRRRILAPQSVPSDRILQLGFDPTAPWRQMLCVRRRTGVIFSLQPWVDFH